jgi:hypothetical protein
LRNSASRWLLLQEYKNICGCIERADFLLAMSIIHSSWAVAGFNFHKSEKHHANTVAHIFFLKDVELVEKSRRTE